MRDEAATLPALLAGLARQSALREARLIACFFLDGCTDASARILRAAAHDLPYSIMIASGSKRGQSNAGRARRAALALGLDALGNRDGVLLTTDADSVPADDWVARNMEALASADMVAGRIVRAGTPSPMQDRLEAYLDALHAFRRQLDPVDWEGPATHHFTGGASLGFRASAYRALGGFAPVASGEDARIVDDASRLGLRVRRDPACTVTTSARREGRAEGGLALALRAHDRAGATPTVAHPEDAAWQYRMHAAARACFDQGDLERIAALLGLTRDHALGVARDCANAEAFAMRIVPVPPGSMRQVSLDYAEAALCALQARQLAVVA